MPSKRVKKCHFRRIVHVPYKSAVFAKGVNNIRRNVLSSTVLLFFFSSFFFKSHVYIRVFQGTVKKFVDNLNNLQTI